MPVMLSYGETVHDSVFFKYDAVEAAHNGAVLKVTENVRYSLIMSV